MVYVIACFITPRARRAPADGDGTRLWITSASADVTRGQRVFMENCHQCHPGGEGGLGPAINNKPLPGFMIKLQVRAGVGAMPAFSADAIAPDELDTLIAYLRALRAFG